MGNDRWGAGGLGLSRERCKQHYKHMFFFCLLQLATVFCTCVFVHQRKNKNKQTKKRSSTEQASDETVANLIQRCFSHNDSIPRESSVNKY